MIKKFNISKPAIERRIEGVAKERARNYLGKPTAVYHMKAIESLLKPLLEIRAKAQKGEEVKVDSSGRYTEAAHEEEESPTIWITIHAFYSQLSEETQNKTSTAALKRYADKNCRSMEAIDRHERAAKAAIYPFEELSTLSIIQNEIRVDEDGIYTDEGGEEWASGRTWRDIYAVSQKALDRGIKKQYSDWDEVPCLNGFGLAKREDPLYPREIIEDALGYIFEADHLEVNGVMTNIQEGPSGPEETIYATVEEIQSIIPEEIIPRYRYRRKFSENRINAIDRAHGGEVATFDLNAIIDHFRDRISEQLAQIEAETDSGDPANGRLVSLSAYLQKHPEKDRKQLIAVTDLAKR